jgi:hypothetical protein
MHTQITDERQIPIQSEEFAMKENQKGLQSKATKMTFSISRAFRNVNDLRNWIQHPEQDKTNNGFLYVQIPRFMDDSDYNTENDEQYYRKTPVREGIKHMECDSP